jgi:hypothetical protein
LLLFEEIFANDEQEDYNAWSGRVIKPISFVNSMNKDENSRIALQIFVLHTEQWNQEPRYVKNRKRFRETFGGVDPFEVRLNT